MMVFVCSNVQWCTIVCVHHLIYDARHHSSRRWMADFLALPLRHFAFFFIRWWGRGGRRKWALFVCVRCGISVKLLQMHRPSDGCIRSLLCDDCVCGMKVWDCAKFEVVPVYMCTDLSDFFVCCKNIRNV